jgi:hypothetical protein
VAVLIASNNGEDQLQQTSQDKGLNEDVLIGAAIVYTSVCKNLRLQSQVSTRHPTSSRALRQVKD